MQSMTWSVLMLIGVIALIPIALWFVKKLQILRTGMSRNLELLSQVSVGQRERVALIRIHDRQIAIGITPHQISLLADFGNSQPGASGPNPGLPNAKGSSLAFSKALSEVRGHHAQE